MASMMYHSMVPMVKMPIAARPPRPADTSSAGTSAAATRPLYLKGPGVKRTPVDAADILLLHAGAVLLLVLLLRKRTIASPLLTNCFHGCCCCCDLSRAVSC